MSSAIHKPKIYAIDNLRGIAAFAVCVFHLSGNHIIPGGGNLYKKIADYGYLGVPLFFAISGFVIPWSLFKSNYQIKNFFSYMLKRIIRIEPPYLISIFLVLILNYLSSLSSLYLGKPFYLDIKQLLAHVVFLPEYFKYTWYQPIYYTLLIEFQFYILCGLLFTWFKSSKISITYILLVCSLLVRYFFPVFIFAVFDMFLVGIIFFKYKTGNININQFWLMQLIVVLFSFINNGDKNIFVIELLTVAGMMYWNHQGRVTRFLANISYSLYLIHIPVGGRFMNLTGRYTHSVYISALFLLIAIALCIVCAWIFYKLVELPAINYSRLLIKSFTKTNTK